MLEIILPFIITLAWTLAGVRVGMALSDRKHRRSNAATARCTACEWSSGPVTLSSAFQAADGHASSEAHRAMVVRA